MEKYWFYLKMNTFIWCKSNKCVVYNSQTGHGFSMMASKKIESLASQLNDLLNMYCIEVNENDFKNPTFDRFINLTKKTLSGGIMELDEKLMKPVIIVPVLKLKHDVKNLKKESFQSINGNALSNLLEVNINLNGLDSKSPFDKSRQFLYPVHSPDVLDYKEILSFINQFGNPSLRRINFIGNITKYSQMDTLCNKIKKFSSIITVYIRLCDLNENLSLIKKFSCENFQIKLIIDPILDEINVQLKVLEIINQNISVTSWQFIVTSIEDCNKATNIISRIKINNYFLSPYYNGSNTLFFIKNVYLKKKDILNSGFNRQEIFAHQALNTYDFGKISILPDGIIYANLNFPPLGKLGNPIIDLLTHEMEKGNSWRRIRDMEPCCNCAYQWLCPSPSNYELAIEKANLCHIKSKNE